MEIICDHTSAGVIITNPANELLLLQRARFPFGLAPPAGHIDEHGSAEQAAVNEVFEEVGIVLPLTSLHKVIETRRIDKQCRRENGDYHIWTVFEAVYAGGPLRPSNTETRGAGWWPQAKLQQLAENTRTTLAGNLTHSDEVLEPTWLDFFVELDYVT